MERMRKPLQGVWNIIRFNWHFYAISLALLVMILMPTIYFAPSFDIFIYIFCAAAFGSILISLIISFYVYDLSNLYDLDWLDGLSDSNGKKIININAGFDETSQILQDKFADAELLAMDFYDDSKHTEVSIKRARKAYPPYFNTKQITTENVNLENNSADKIFLILSAHEIRNDFERTKFFIELNRILDRDGQIILTEHLRDLPNFLAYNIGSFHFHSRNTWLKNIKNAKLKITKEFKITPFITTFILEKNGNTH